MTQLISTNGTRFYLGLCDLSLMRKQSIARFSVHLSQRSKIPSKSSISRHLPFVVNQHVASSSMQVGCIRSGGEWNSSAQTHGRAHKPKHRASSASPSLQTNNQPQPPTMSAFAASDDPDAQDYSFTEDDPAITTPPIPQDQNLSSGGEGSHGRSHSNNPLLGNENPLVSELEQEVLDEYSRLLRNVNQVGKPGSFSFSFSFLAGVFFFCPEIKVQVL